MFRFASWKIGVLLSIASVGICGAQTRFEWPSQQTDVATYKLLDLCLGAASRVSDSVAGVGVLKDTLTLAQYGPFRILDKVIVNSAQRCVSSIPLSSVTIDNTMLAQKVLLVANRDTDVVPLYRKRFDAASADSQKIGVVVSTVRLLIAAAPVRLLLADSLLGDIQPYDGQWVTGDKLDVYGNLCRLSDIARNDALVTKYCGGFISVVDKMADAEYATYGLNLPVTVNQVLRLIARPDLQDSLKKSSSAYVSLARALQTKAFRGWDPKTEIGEKAEPIIGEFWFPENARNVSYPRAGKVTLVTSVKMAASANGGDLSALMMLKRLTAQFPTLDIVALSGTTGHFGAIAPPKPAVEAELNYRKIVDFYKVPLVAAVTTTPFWRISDPDRRRIFDPYPHSETYSKIYRKVLSAENNPKNRINAWANANYSGLLVDADGVIVDFFQASTNREDDLVANIGILMKRATQ